MSTAGQSPSALTRFLTTLLSTATVMLAAASCAEANLPPRPPLRDRVAGYEMTVLVDGIPAETFTHNGGTYVMGELGARYTLRIANHSDRRVEAVVSIDGRDVINGKTGDFQKNRGYLIPAWGSVDIDGWRISQDEAAAFRFSSVPNSYAAQMGSAREVGVIGVAVFPERYIPPVAPPPPRPYAAPYTNKNPAKGSMDDVLDGLSSSEAPAPAARGHRAHAAADDADSPERPGLGTEYGEAVSSPIHEVDFVRANAARPVALMGVRYNDRHGLLAMGIPVDGPPSISDAELRRTADPFPVVDRHYAPPPSCWTRGCGSICCKGP